MSNVETDLSDSENNGQLEWRVQNRQYLARLLFSAILLGYLALAHDFPKVLFGFNEFLFLFAGYMGVITLFWLHTWWQPNSISRARFVMWLDFVGLTLAISHDPNVSLPSLPALLTILLGNGLRYGTRLLAPALLGCYVAVPVVVALRGWQGTLIPVPATFLTLFLYLAMVSYAGYLIWQSNRLRRRLRRLSLRDDVTGLLNQRALMAEGDMLFNMHARTGQPLTLLLIDIDIVVSPGSRQNVVALLQDVSDAFRFHLRNYDVAGRCGPARFVLLLPNTDLRLGNQVAERLNQAITERFAIDQRNPPPLRIAVGQAPEDGTDFVQLLKYVEARLRSAENKLDLNTPGLPSTVAPTGASELPAGD